MTHDEVVRVQLAVNQSGIAKIAVDGIYGEITEAAYKELLRRSTVGGTLTPMPVPAAAKPWWTSAAAVGGLARMVAMAAGFAGWSIDPSGLSLVISLMLAAGFGAIEFYGTVRRKAPIDQTLVLPGIRLPTVTPESNGYWSDKHGPLDPE